MQWHSLDDFTQGFVTGLLWWSEMDYSDDNGGNPLEDNYDWSDFSESAQSEIVEACRSFQESAGDAILSDLEKAGIDFCLTRNRHGAGFWDGDWPKDIGKRLTDLSHGFGECSPVIGDDGRLYL